MNFPSSFRAIFFFLPCSVSLDLCTLTRCRPYPSACHTLKSLSIKIFSILHKSYPGNGKEWKWLNAVHCTCVSLPWALPGKDDAKDTPFNVRRRKTKYRIRETQSKFTYSIFSNAPYLLASSFASIALNHTEHRACTLWSSETPDSLDTVDK